MQYREGDEVWLFNPRMTRQRVAVGKISGLPGQHQFHFCDIPETWFKVDVITILQPSVPLMYPNAEAEHSIIEHVKGTSTIWDQKYLKTIM